MTGTVTTDDPCRAFVRSLYRLHSDLSAPDPRRRASARRDLARLRRSVAGPQQAAQAYDIILCHLPPVEETEQWLLVAGLFALHPLASDTAGRSLGWAMGQLVVKRPAAERRFTQLLSVDLPALPHYLRQAIQLLRAGGIPLDYYRLLQHLLTIKRSPHEGAHRVRLGWARDYHRARYKSERSPAASDETAPDTTAPVNASQEIS